MDERTRLPRGRPSNDRLRSRRSTLPVINGRRPHSDGVGDQRRSGGGVPAELTSFVGRSEELADVERLVAGRRLVTLTGIGGCGKSRLATRLAVRMASAWVDGVWWIDLAPITDAEQVTRTVAAMMDLFIDPDHDPLLALGDRLRTRELLLCLDSCEHLLTPCAALTGLLLRTCPGVSVLATSREPLGVSGETIWRVPPLTEEESIGLFVDRARLVSPGFRSEEHEATVRAICDRVDGIPLAVELAAAWVRVLSPEQIGTGLDTSLQLLAGGPRDAPARHQTLAASMAWSHSLLGEDDRVVFRRLAVFAGDFSLDAAAAVCADDDPDAGSDLLAALTRLVDKSLIVVRDDKAIVRYRLLDTVRQYAEERLDEAGELAACRSRHLGYYLEQAELADRQLDDDQDTWRQFLASHHDNIAAAISRGLQDSDLGEDRVRRLVAAMARFWFVRGWAHQGLSYLQAAIAQDPSARSAVQGRLWCGVAMLGMVSGRLDQAAAAAEQGLAISAENADEVTRARCLVMAAYRPYYFDFERCHRLATEGHEAGMAAGDSFSRDWGLVVAGYSLSARDRYDEATQLASSAVQQSMPRGDRFCAAFARGIDLFAALYTGDVQGAVTIGDEMLTIVEPLGDYFAVGTNLSQAALARGMAGDIVGGLDMFAPIVQSITQTRDADAVGYMVTLGMLRLWAGDLAEAVHWLERGIRSLTPDGVDWTAARCMAGLAGAQRRLANVEQAQWAASRAVALGRSFGSRLILADGLDEQAFLIAERDPDRALGLHHEALAVRSEAGLRTVCADSLDALAAHALRTGSPQNAARLYAACTAAREQMGYPRHPVDEPALKTDVSTLRQVLDLEFDTVWGEGLGLTLDDALGLATRGRGPRERPSSGWPSLTPTELTVAALVAQGLTNPEIASQLFISRTTVKTHLVHIFRKLDITNRTELARIATERERESPGPDAD